VLKQTILHLQSCLPREGVGLWSGVAGDTPYVTRFTALHNAADTPLTRYAVHPAEWIEALAAVQRDGEVPLALVHSHPTGEAIPSRQDLREWYYPDLWCVIVSFRAHSPIWRAYRI